MRFIDHHKVPGCSDDILRLIAGEVIGTDDKARLGRLEGCGVARLGFLLIRASF